MKEFIESFVDQTSVERYINYESLDQKHCKMEITNIYCHDGLFVYSSGRKTLSTSFSIKHFYLATLLNVS